MALWNNQFGDQSESSPGEAGSPTPVPAAATLPADETVTVFDEYGRSFQMPKAEWRETVLLPNIEQKRNDPDALSNLIVGALRDGFAADALEGARHLQTIDPQRLRSANLLGVVLLHLKRDDEARLILEAAITQHGPKGYVLTNLAKAYAGLGDVNKRDAVLWQALELDPNQDNGLLWYGAVEIEKHGAGAETAALERVAALPKSWRAQLWLARAALAREDVDGARRLYNQALSRMDPVPADALMQISGDLGNQGQFALLLEICTPLFNVKLHGIQAGNNLIKANLDLGRTEDARAILEQLYAQQRPDWREPLGSWERKIDDAEKRFGPVDGQFKVGFGALDQPLFAYGRLGFEAFLPAKSATSVRVTFICGTGETAGPKSTQPLIQRSDALGQVSRTVPLWLAEEIHLTTSARAKVLVPVTEKGSFVLFGAPVDLEALSRSKIETDLLVLLHVSARAEPWDLKFSVYTWPTKAVVATWTIPYAVSDPLPGLRAAIDKVTAELMLGLGISVAPGAQRLPRPADDQLWRYVSCLETALMMAFANRPNADEHLLWGERALIDGLFDLAASGPDNLRSRLLLLNTLEKEARRRPDIVKEYSEKLLLLQKRHSLPPGQAANLVAAAIDQLRNVAKAN